MSATTAALRQSWLLTQRDLRHWVREPWAPIFGVVFSLMLVAVFGFLLGGAVELPDGGDYRSYLLPGMFALLAVLIGGGLLVGWSIDDGAGRAMLAVALLLWLRFAVLWLGVFLGLTFRAEGSLMAVQVLVWPIGFLSGVIVPPETMPAWLAAVADWNPISATAAACRELFGNPTGITEGVLGSHAVLLAAAWPLLLSAVFVPLSVRAYRRLG